jgi:energy-coupling factor transporter ATP-binding protein EcfA2
MLPAITWRLLSMFCRLEDLRTESDVEQKFVWSLLTFKEPLGLGFTASDISTKLSIRRLEINKGQSKKIYYPDYMIIIAGLPVIIIEAKAPSESVEDGLEEALLYAAKLNSLFPTEINPCMRVVSTNGIKLLCSPWDSASPDIDIEFSNISAGSIDFEKLISTIGKTTADGWTKRILSRFAKRPLSKPTALLGGQSVRNEEIGHNKFGATVALEYRHLFNPSTHKDRAFVVKNAYIPSRRRERYIEPIDRLIQSIVSPGLAHIQVIEDSSKPQEVLSKFSNRKVLEHEVMLLIGSVGSGKSTFVDYLSNVALSDTTLAKTLWVRVDLNVAPLNKDMVYTWIAEQLLIELQQSRPDLDFESLEMLLKIYAPEINKLKKGPLALLSQKSEDYKGKLSTRLFELQNDVLNTAKSTARHICGETGKLLIVVLDNCDKRIRDEQLLMFQVAKWIQEQFVCLVILPIRDVTYNLHKNEPPLDTALKDLVFKIEPPLFQKVLESRVHLALKAMSSVEKQRVMHYDLPNGMRVEYPSSDQGMYLACILRSLYEHDKFVRRLISGLAGRDLRKAMEIFLEFCSSGHISEDEIFKIRAMSGDYTLPLGVVSSVLLRMNRRFYDGDLSQIKNLFQCTPEDAKPDNFIRLAILRWLNNQYKEQGPSGITGFHAVSTLLRDLIQTGHEEMPTRRELLYLLQSTCIVAEHQRTDSLSDDDLICISPSGSVHLTMLSNVEYLAACSEDIWYSNRTIVEKIAERIGSSGRDRHYSRGTTLANAKDLLEYLHQCRENQLASPSIFLSTHATEELTAFAEADIAFQKAQQERLIQGKTRIYIGGLSAETDKDSLEKALVDLGFTGISGISIPLDLQRSRNKGFAFVTIIASEDEIINKVDGAYIDGRRVHVGEAAMPKVNHRSDAAELPPDYSIDEDGN